MLWFGTKKRLIAQEIELLQHGPQLPILPNLHGFRQIFQAKTSVGIRSRTELSVETTELFSGKNEVGLWKVHPKIFVHAPMVTRERCLSYAALFFTSTPKNPDPFVIATYKIRTT